MPSPWGGFGVSLFSGFLLFCIGVPQRSIPWFFGCVSTCVFCLFCLMLSLSYVIVECSTIVFVRHGAYHHAFEFLHLRCLAFFFMDFCVSLNEWFIPTEPFLWVLIFYAVPPEQHVRSSSHAKSLSSVLETILIYIAALCCFSLFTSYVVWDFNPTLGFPGEGPKEKLHDKLWTCLSANIDSLQTHSQWATWPQDIVFLQETRLSATNLPHAQTQAAQNGHMLLAGPTLVPKKNSVGHFVTPHGGVAIRAKNGFARNFQEEDDATGLWKSIKSNSRICASWVQVLPKLRVLCFSFYGQASLADGSHLRINNFLLEQIFCIASQFGDVPVIIAGDFQTEPECYEAFVNAKNHANWSDPLAACDQQGNCVRPITYSQKCNFVDPSEGFSSIDGILVNKIACASLVDITVDFASAKQHAPIIATFEWGRCFQTGYVLMPTAPFDLTLLPKNSQGVDDDKLSDIADQLWDSKYAHKDFRGSEEDEWKSLNQFGVDILLKAGASFGQGLRTRGLHPKFQTKNPCPGQDFNGSAITTVGSHLVKLMQLVTELRHRFLRKASKASDFQITFALQEKVTRLLQKHPDFKWWNPQCHLNSDALLVVQKQLHSLIDTNRRREKMRRINNWKLKVIQGTRNKKVSSFVFAWIKQKSTVVSNNLIVNQDGHIIFNPMQAIDHINDTWDQVFSVNMLHHDPVDVLAKAWPLLSEIRSPACVPDLTGKDLKGQVMLRKANAASGLDGWRTVEAKSLPTAFYNRIANFFCNIETGQITMPKILTTVRQVLLNKNGQDEPLQKRIISLLPVFTLAYTGLRFKQLQQWQANILPKNLFGGIKGRRLGDVHSMVRLELDEAFTSKHPIVGIKLDKAKCFDRLVPSISAALMLALGIPKNIVTFFLGLYSSMSRHMSYKNWISHRSTTSPNGLVQGCSFSLLAINAHMAVWALAMQTVPQVSSCAFIDDSYIWARLDHIAQLQLALDKTIEWDSYTGQALNSYKSEAWGSSCAARKTAKQIFPSMKHPTCVNILGAIINLTENNKTGWDEKKTEKILKDLRAIHAIPCSRDVADHIIATKVIPQVGFAPHLGRIPKKVLQTIQDRIADTLWKGRPMWRSRSLLFGLLSKPHRSEPFLARAYAVILDTISFLKTALPDMKRKWQVQVENGSVSQNSLLQHFLQACSIFRIQLCDPFHFSIWNCEPINFFDLGRRELKIILQHACRHNCYANAALAARKDIKKPEHILDFPLTMAVQKQCMALQHKGLSLGVFRDSSLVGCTITNDRRYKAGMVSSNSCRFCQQPLEDMSHLVHDCCHIPIADERPTYSDFGPNFKILGIVEIHVDEVRQRLMSSNLSAITVVDWYFQDIDSFKEFWTDGSCDFGELFWQTQGAFSVVDSNNRVIQVGPVYHPSLSSYSCELLAIIHAFAGSDKPTRIFTDCQAISSQIEYLITHREVPSIWSHHSWFVFLLTIITHRMGFFHTPLVVEWCPAHLFENIPIDLITPQQARAKGTTIRNIRHNRTADFAAKQFVKHNARVRPDIVKARVQAICEWQLWIAKVNAIVSDFADVGTDISNSDDHSPEVDNPIVDIVIPPQHDLTVEHSIDIFRHFLPLWQWEPDESEFVWQTEFPHDVALLSYASLSKDDWSNALAFFRQLKWKCDPSLKVSYVELAFEFWHRKFSCEQPSLTIYDVIKMIRKVVNQSCKLRNLSKLTPTEQKPGCKSNGKTHPAGFLLGAYPLLSVVALKHLAVHFMHKHNQNLSSWKIQFPNNGS